MFDEQYKFVPSGRSEDNHVQWIQASNAQWVRGLMVANVGFEFRDWSSIPIMCQITGDGLRQVVYIVP